MVQSTEDSSSWANAAGPRPADQAAPAAPAGPRTAHGTFAEPNGPAWPPDEGRVVVCAQALGKSFGQVQALRAIDLEVRRAELFGVIGADGAGKTTLLRLLGGVLCPTTGRVTVLGCDVASEVEALRGRVGYVAQQFSLYGDLTVVENLRFFADLFGVGEVVRRERTTRLLEAARLAEFGGRRAAALSGGMQKKLALACALVHNPELLLLDEPTTGVDPVSRREFWQILTDLRLAGMTIVASTPYMEEADRCSRLAVLDRGRLLVAGPPEAIRARVPGRLFEARLSDPEGGREVLLRVPGVETVERRGDVLRIRVAPEVTTDRLAEALTAAGLAVERLKEVAPRMHEALAVLMAVGAGREAGEVAVAGGALADAPGDSGRQGNG